MLRIDDKFNLLMFDLRLEEKTRLEQSIITEGCRDALVCWGDILIDGYNRFEICQKHGIPFNIVQREFTNRKAVEDWIINNQLARRNLTHEQRSYLIGKRYKAEKQMHGGGRKSSRQNVDLKRTSEIIASEYKTSSKTVERAEKFADAVDVIASNTTPQIRRQILTKEIDGTQKDILILAQTDSTIQQKVIELVQHGEVDEIKEAIRVVKQKQRTDCIEALKTQINNGLDLPEGVFEVMVIDPPWPYGTSYNPDGRRAASPYPEMTLEEIRTEPYPFADDCLLWLWATHKFMHEAFHLIEGWFFQDVAILTWVKNSIGLGSWLRSQTEFCIMAIKGRPRVDLTNQSTVISSPGQHHSGKPDEFYEMVDSLCIGRKLDYYGRKSRKGWEVYGTK